VVWHSLVAKQNDTLRALADEYNAGQSRVHVQIENVAATDEELMRKFTAAVPSRQLPALFVGNDTENFTSPPRPAVSRGGLSRRARRLERGAVPQLATTACGCSRPPARRTARRRCQRARKLGGNTG